MEEIAIILAVVVCAFGGFWLLDRWHQGYAWRKANKEATRLMRDQFGVEPDGRGGWRKVK